MTESSGFSGFSFFGNSGSLDFSTVSEEFFELIFVTSVGQVSNEDGYGVSNGSLGLLGSLLLRSFFVGSVVDVNGSGHVYLSRHF